MVKSMIGHFVKTIETYLYDQKSIVSVQRIHFILGSDNYQNKDVLLTINNFFKEI